MRGVRCVCRVLLWKPSSRDGQRNRPDALRPIEGLSSGRVAIQLRGSGSSYGVVLVCACVLTLSVRPAVYCRVADPRKRGVGGAEEARTPDPLLAKEVLSQLSYGPVAGLSVFGDWRSEGHLPTSNI